MVLVLTFPNARATGLVATQLKEHMVASWRGLRYERVPFVIRI